MTSRSQSVHRQYMSSANCMEMTDIGSLPIHFGKQLFTMKT